MNPFDVYTKYLAVQQHFNGSYDYFKYGGKVKANVDSFNLRKDKYFFHRLSKKIDDNDLELFLASNFCENNRIWVGELLSEHSKEVLNKHKKFLESLSYQYEEELDKQFSTNKFQELFVSQDKQIPGIVHKLKRNEIQIETFCLLSRDLKLYDTIDSKIDDDVIWPKIKMAAMKFYPFMKIGNDMCKNITIRKLKEYYHS